MYLIALLCIIVCLCSSQELTATLLISNRPATVLLDLTNTAPYSVALLRWNLPLDNRFGSDSFIIRVNGNPVTYIGPKVHYAGPYLDDYVLLPSNTTITTEIRLSDSYDFSQLGDYSVVFDVDVLDYEIESGFNSLPHDRQLLSPYEKITSNSLQITITIPLLPEKKVSVYPCSEDEIQQIKAGFEAAQIESQQCVNTINQGDSTAHYRRWFGAPNQNRFITVRDNIHIIHQSFLNTEFLYECDEYEGVYAYVYPSDMTHTIYYCDLYWVVPVAGGFDTKAGTVYHEASHFDDIARTDDLVYGVTGCEELARNSPNDAILNADNYAYLAESLWPSQ